MYYCNHCIGNYLHKKPKPIFVCASVSQIYMVVHFQLSSLLYFINSKEKYYIRKIFFVLFCLENEYFLQTLNNDWREIHSLISLFFFSFSVVTLKMHLMLSCLWNDFTGVVMDDDTTNFVKLRVPPYHKRYQMRLVNWQLRRLFRYTETKQSTVSLNFQMWGIYECLKKVLLPVPNV